MKKTICITLVLAVLCCALSGCGGLLTDALFEKAMEKVDIAKLLSSVLELDISQFISGDVTSADGAMEDVLEGLQQSVYDMLEEQAAKLGADISVEDMLEASGTDFDEVFDTLIGQMDLDRLIEEAISEKID